MPRFMVPVPATNTAAAERARSGDRRANRESALEQQLAKTQQQLADQQERAAAAEVAAGVHRMLSGAGLGAVDARRVENLVLTERLRCARTGEAFDLAFTVTQQLHATRARSGAPAGVAPVSPRGMPMHPAPGVQPETFDARMATTAAYREQLRRLGLLDPATSSIPGGGGPFHGGG